MAGLTDILNLGVQIQLSLDTKDLQNQVNKATKTIGQIQKNLASGFGNFAKPFDDIVKSIDDATNKLKKASKKLSEEILVPFKDLNNEVASVLGNMQSSFQSSLAKISQQFDKASSSIKNFKDKVASMQGAAGTKIPEPDITGITKTQREIEQKFRNLKIDPQGVVEFQGVVNSLRKDFSRLTNLLIPPKDPKAINVFKDQMLKLSRNLDLAKEKFAEFKAISDKIGPGGTPQLSTSLKQIGKDIEFAETKLLVLERQSSAVLSLGLLSSELDRVSKSIKGVGQEAQESLTKVDVSAVRQKIAILNQELENAKKRFDDASNAIGRVAIDRMPALKQSIEQLRGKFLGLQGDLKKALEVTKIKDFEIATQQAIETFNLKFASAKDSSSKLTSALQTLRKQFKEAQDPSMLSKLNVTSSSAQKKLDELSASIKSLRRQLSSLPPDFAEVAKKQIQSLAVTASKARGELQKISQVSLAAKGIEDFRKALAAVDAEIQNINSSLNTGGKVNFNLFNRRLEEAKNLSNSLSKQMAALPQKGSKKVLSATALLQNEFSGLNTKLTAVSNRFKDFDVAAARASGSLDKVSRSAGKGRKNLIGVLAASGVILGAIRSIRNFGLALLNTLKENIEVGAEFEGELVVVARKAEFLNEAVQLAITAQDNLKNKVFDSTDALKNYGITTERINALSKELSVSTNEVVGRITEQARALIKLKEELFKINTILPQSARELGQIAVIGKTLGFSLRELPGFVEFVAKTTLATGLSAKEAALEFGRLASVLQLLPKGAFAKTAEGALQTKVNLEKLAGAVIRVANSIKGEADDIVKIVKRAGSIGINLGFSVEDMIAIAGILKDVGLESKRAGTNLLRLFAEFPIAKNFNKLVRLAGLNILDMREELEAAVKSGNTAQVMMKVFAALAKQYTDNNIEFAESLRDVFGKRAGITQVLFGIVQNMDKIRSLSKRAAGEFTKSTEEIKKGLGLLSKEAEKARQQWTVLMRLISSAIENIKVQIFDLARVRLKPIADAVFKALQHFGKLSPEIRLAILEMTALVGVASTFLGVLFGFAVVVKSLEAINLTLADITATMFDIVTGKFFISLVAGAAAAGIAFIALKAVYGKNANFIENSIQSIGNAILEVMNVLKAFGQSILDFFVSGFTSIAPSIISLMNSLKAFAFRVLELFGLIGDASQIASNGVLGSFVKMLNFLKPIFFNIIKSVINLFTIVVNFILNIFTSDLIKEIKTKFGFVFGFLLLGFKDLMEGIGGFLSATISAIKIIFNLAAPFIRGFISGLLDIFVIIGFVVGSIVKVIGFVIKILGKATSAILRFIEPLFLFIAKSKSFQFITELLGNLFAGTSSGVGVLVEAFSFVFKIFKPIKAGALAIKNAFSFLPKIFSSIVNIFPFIQRFFTFILTKAKSLLIILDNFFGIILNKFPIISKIFGGFISILKKIIVSFKILFRFGFARFGKAILRFFSIKPEVIKNAFQIGVAFKHVLRLFFGKKSINSGVDDANKKLKITNAILKKSKKIQEAISSASFFRGTKEATEAAKKWLEQLNKIENKQKKISAIMSLRKLPAIDKAIIDRFKEVQDRLSSTLKIATKDEQKKFVKGISDRIKVIQSITAKGLRNVSLLALKKPKEANEVLGIISNLVLSLDKLSKIARSPNQARLVLEQLSKIKFDVSNIDSARKSLKQVQKAVKETRFELSRLLSKKAEKAGLKLNIQGIVRTDIGEASNLIDAIVSDFDKLKRASIKISPEIISKRSFENANILIERMNLLSKIITNIAKLQKNGLINRAESEKAIATIQDQLSSVAKVFKENYSEFLIGATGVLGPDVLGGIGKFRKSFADLNKTFNELLKDKNFASFVKELGLPFISKLKESDINLRIAERAANIQRNVIAAKDSLGAFRQEMEKLKNVKTIKELDFQVRSLTLALKFLKNANAIPLELAKGFEFFNRKLKQINTKKFDEIIDTFNKVLDSIKRSTLKGIFRDVDEIRKKLRSGFIDNKELRNKILILKQDLKTINEALIKKVPDLPDIKLRRGLLKDVKQLSKSISLLENQMKSILKLKVKIKEKDFRIFENKDFVKNIKESLKKAGIETEKQRDIFLKNVLSKDIFRKIGVSTGIKLKNTLADVFQLSDNIISQIKSKEKIIQINLEIEKLRKNFEILFGKNLSKKNFEKIASGFAKVFPIIVKSNKEFFERAKNPISKFVLFLRKDLGFSAKEISIIIQSILYNLKKNKEIFNELNKIVPDIDKKLKKFGKINTGIDISFLNNSKIQTKKISFNFDIEKIKALDKFIDKSISRDRVVNVLFKTKEVSVPSRRISVIDMSSSLASFEPPSLVMQRPSMIANENQSTRDINVKVDTSELKTLLSSQSKFSGNIVLEISNILDGEIISKVVKEIDAREAFRNTGKSDIPFI